MRFMEYLLEEDRKIYATKRTPEEIKSLPTLSASTLESVARVGDVVFDQEKGLGSVPNNQNIVYRGFVAMMYPRDFSSFAQKADREEDAKNIVKLIEQGYGIGSPFLDLDINERSMRITGHEGRARCVALNYIQPNVLIPVHFMLDGEKRARHINDQIVSMLNDHIMAEGSQNIVANKIRSIWLGGKQIEL